MDFNTKDNVIIRVLEGYWTEHRDINPLTPFYRLFEYPNISFLNFFFFFDKSVKLYIKKMQI